MDDLRLTHNDLNSSFTGGHSGQWHHVSRLSIIQGSSSEGKHLLSLISFFGSFLSFFQFQDAKEYMKWMMYWIAFACFCVLESFADIFLSFWFPFYYELKIAFVFWLVSPWTKGATIFYRKVSCCSFYCYCLVDSSDVDET